MDAAKFAKVICPHVGVGWEHVADVARPGAAQKVAAVRDGEVSTTTLAIDDALRVAAEAADPAAVTEGDSRKRVREAVTGTTAPRTTASPTAKLFQGTPAEVAAAVSARRSVTAAMIDAYLAAPEDVRAAVALPLLRVGDQTAVAAVLTERAATCPAEVFELLRATFAGFAAVLAAAPRGPRNAAAQDAVRQETVVRQGAALAMSGWLTVHGAPEAQVAGIDGPGQPPADPPLAAGPPLTLLTVLAGFPVLGAPADGARAVLAAFKTLVDSTKRVDAMRRTVIRTVAASGLSWAEVRAALLADRPERDTIALRDLLSMFDNARSADGPTAAFFAELVATEFAEPYTGPTAFNFTAQAEAPALLDRAGLVPTLRFLAATGNGHPEGRYAYTALVKVAGRVPPAALLEAVTGDVGLRAHVAGVLTQQLAAVAEAPATLWDIAVAVLPSSTFAAAAAQSAPVAVRWGAELTASVEAAVAAGADRAELWQAVCALAPTVGHPTGEVVELAAVTVGG